MIYFEGRAVDQPSPATTIGKRGGLTVRLAERLAFWRQTGAHGHVVDAGGLVYCSRPEPCEPVRR